MIRATKKDTGNFVYMRLKKHNCPICQGELKIKKMTKVVKAKTKAAADFNFSTCELPLSEKVKFVWYEFRCKNCNQQFTEAQMKEHEKKLRRDEKAKKKAEKKAEKK